MTSVLTFALLHRHWRSGRPMAVGPQSAQTPDGHSGCACGTEICRDMQTWRLPAGPGLSMKIIKAWTVNEDKHRSVVRLSNTLCGPCTARPCTVTGYCCTLWLYSSGLAATPVRLPDCAVTADRCGSCVRRGRHDGRGRVQVVRYRTDAHMSDVRSRDETSSPCIAKCPCYSLLTS